MRLMTVTEAARRVATKVTRRRSGHPSPPCPCRPRWTSVPIFQDGWVYGAVPEKPSSYVGPRRGRCKVPGTTTRDAIRQRYGTPTSAFMSMANGFLSTTLNETNAQGSILFGSICQKTSTIDLYDCPSVGPPSKGGLGDVESLLEGMNRLGRVVVVLPCIHCPLLTF